MPLPPIPANTFGLNTNLGSANTAWDRTTDLGVAGSTGLANYGGVQGGRTLDAPVMQPVDSAAAIVRFNQVMADTSEHFDPFIQRDTLEHPRFWHDRVPRGAYTLFSGASKQTRIFRGGLGHYAGLAHWGDIKDYSVTTGKMNGQAYPDKYPDPVTYGFSWQQLEWSGKNMSWASDPIDIDLFRFTAEAQTQLSWILQAGVEFGVTQQEVWNRDNMIFAAVQNGRGFIMTNGGESAGVDQQFYYNPYSYGPSASGYLSEVPFILFPADVDVQPLNFDVLDYANDALAVRAPNSGIGSENGRPVFGLPISMRDFEKYVKGNQNELLNWREAMPMDLIKGYGMLLKSYRYYGMIEDTNQLRFNVKKVITAQAAAAGGVTVFGNSATTQLFLAEYVPPRKLSTAGANNMGIPQENMEYIKADLAISPLFMNNVFTNQFVPETPQLGSGTSFGSVNGLNGKWGWQNIIDKTTNRFGKVGNFYGILEIFPKPEQNFVDMTAFLYRRCTETLRSRCPVNIDAGTGVTATIASTSVTTADAGETVIGKAFNFTLSKPLDVTIGTPVSIAIVDKNAAAGVIYGAIAGLSGASTYSIVILDVDGKLGSGSGASADGTMFTATNFPVRNVITVL